MPDRTVRIEQVGRVLTARLDNPPRNFMTGAMVRELDALVRDVEDDPSVGVVILTGAPEDVFITHFDVAEIAAGAGSAGRVSPGQAAIGLRAVDALSRVAPVRDALQRTPAAGALGLQEIHALFDRMNRVDKVFIAAINGVALGGGCELALACDVRIMADGGGRIGLPECTLGIIPGAGGTQRLTRTIGPGRALEAMLEGRAFSPDEAVGLGLVHRLVKPARLMDEAVRTGERLARRSPTAVGALKRAVYEGASRPLGEGLHIERAGFLAAASTEAAGRAMAVYVREVEAAGDVTSEEALTGFDQWREGTAVDMVDGG